MNLEKIKAFVTRFTDRGQAQLSSAQNAAAAISDPCATLTRKLVYSLVGDEAQDEYIGIAFVKKGADILWHELKMLVDSNSDGLTLEVGTMDKDGNFTLEATLGAASGFVSTPTLEEPHNATLAEGQWIVAKITNATPPTSGDVALYLPYIALG